MGSSETCSASPSASSCWATRRRAAGGAYLAQILRTLRNFLTPHHPSSAVPAHPRLRRDPPPADRASSPRRRRRGVGRRAARQARAGEGVPAADSTRTRCRRCRGLPPRPPPPRRPRAPPPTPTPPPHPAPPAPHDAPPPAPPPPLPPPAARRAPPLGLRLGAPRRPPRARRAVIRQRDQPGGGDARRRRRAVRLVGARRGGGDLEGCRAIRRNSGAIRRNCSETPPPLQGRRRCCASSCSPRPRAGAAASRCTSRCGCR